MNRWCLSVIGTVVLMSVLPATASGEARQVEGKGSVAEVTLYRGQAQVVRDIPVEGPAGSVELVVTGLPQQVQPDSIFGEGGDGIEVRAVRYRARAVGEAPTQEIADLDKQILDAEDEVALVEQRKQVLARRAEYLDKLEGFVVPTASSDLARGVLDAGALEKITTMNFQQREQIAEAVIELRKQEREAREQLNLLQRRRNELTRGRSRTVHEAVVFLEKTGNAATAVRLTYLVGNCGWGPAYNFRADSAKKTIDIEYNALIHQMSGEDWTGVRLTLSTATPQLSAAAPGLAPFRVTLARGDDPNRNLSAAALRSQVRDIKARQQSYNTSQLNAVQFDDNLRANWQMNVGANDYQLLELGNGEKKLRVIQDEGGALADGPSLSYQMAKPVSLASRSDQQMIRIMEHTLAGTFYHTATPVLTAHVYREADLVNTTDLDLLSGQVNMYLDGRFVGRMEIPTVARGQSLVVGFGADPQLRASRELVTRNETTQGGNQVVTFAYRLVIENYKGQATPVRVFDRLPYTEDSKDLRVTLDDLQDKLSTDNVYLRIDRPKGILRRDIEVPANAAGAKARMVSYGYQLEYARDYYLANPLAFRADQGGQAPNAPAQQEEFMELQMQRMLKQ